MPAANNKLLNPKELNDFWTDYLIKGSPISYYAKKYNVTNNIINGAIDLKLKEFKKNK